MSRTKSAFLGSISSQVFMLISMFLTIAITPLLLKYLNKEEYGYYTILFQIIGYLSMLDFGLGGAIARSLAANRGEDERSKLAINKIITTSVYTYSILGAVVIITAFVFTPYIPRFFRMAEGLGDVAIPITLTLSVFVGLQFPLKIFNSIFYAHQRQLLSNTMNFVINILNALLPVLFLFFGQGLWSFVYTNVICSIVSLAVTFTLIRRFYPYLRIKRNFFDKALLKDLFHFGFFLFLGSVAYQVVFFTDRFFIGSFVSLTAATMFALTVKAPDLSRELIFRITDNAFPAMVEISAKEGENKIRKIHQKLLLVSVCLSTIAFWLIYIVNSWFVELWVGEQFFAGQTILLLALVIMVQHIILHVSSLCLFGIGFVKGTSIMGIIEAGVNLVLTLWLGKIYGIKGILMATMFASWLTVLWYVPYATMKNLKIKLSEYLFKPLLFPLLAISSVGLTIHLLTNNLFRQIQLNWVSFFCVSAIIGSLLCAFTWFVFLRKAFSRYVPPRFRKYLFAS